MGAGELLVRKVGGLQAVLSQDVLAVMGGSLAGLCTLQSDPAGQAPNAQMVDQERRVASLAMEQFMH